MDQATLVNEQVDGGTKLLLRLRDCGFDMVAACWAKTYYDARMYLYIVSPSIAGRDSRPSYKIIHDILRQMEGEWTQPFERIKSTRVKLIDSGELLARWLLGFYCDFPPTKSSQQNAGNFNAVFVTESVYGDGAWIYPPTLFSAPQPIA